MRITGEQMGAARGLLRWTQQDLADASGISSFTVKRLEAMRGTVSAHSDTINNIVDAFNKAGIKFIESDNGGPGVRLKK